MHTHMLSLRRGLKAPPSRAAVSALCLQGAAPSLLLGVLAWLQCMFLPVCAVSPRRTPPTPRLRQGPLSHFCLSDVSILPGSLKAPAEVWGTSGCTGRVVLPVNTPSHHPWCPGPRVPQTRPAEFWVEALPPAALDGMEAAGQVTSQASAIS